MYYLPACTSYDQYKNFEERKRFYKITKRKPLNYSHLLKWWSMQIKLIFFNFILGILTNTFLSIDEFFLLIGIQFFIVSFFTLYSYRSQ